MKKLVIAILTIGVMGIGYWLVAPLFIKTETNERLEEILVSDVAAEPIGQGFFEGLAKHRAVGTARLLKIDGKYYVRFDDDFDITNGPDLFVDLGRDGEHDSNARLGKLKGSVGGQNYEVPEGINIEDYNEVWVWCRAFGVPFGKAKFIKYDL